LKGSNRDEARYMRSRPVESRLRRTGNCEEKRGRWWCRKARATGQRTIVREMELGKSNGGEGMEEKFGRGGSTVRTKTNPRNHHTDSAAWLGLSTVGTSALYFHTDTAGAMPCAAHVPGRSTAGQRMLLIGSLIDLPPECETAICRERDVFRTAQ
jgi:hypothetical protein